MQKGYVFIANSTKPSAEKANSREPVVLKNFCRPCVEAAISHGYKVFLGVNRSNPEELKCDYAIKLFDSHTYRSITALKDNIIAYRNLSRIMEENDIECIHCNTPVGGMIGRLCARKFHTKKVIYTAHGFHFYKGAPLINRTIYKWAEMIMAHWTDAIITMNQEDYEAAQKFRLRKNGRVFKSHGVGISLSEFKDINTDRKSKRAEIGISETDIVCISAGDLVPRKNYCVAIRAVAACCDPRIHYIICGNGPSQESLEKIARDTGVDKQVHFLGFRTDIKELMKASDIFLFSTLQEGLPRSLMEAMASGLPVVASKIRGNVDLITNGEGGYLEEPNDVASFAKDIAILVNNENVRKRMAEVNLERIRDYDIAMIKKEIMKIYNDILDL